jgi:hypothetical protein
LVKLEIHVQIKTELLNENEGRKTKRKVPLPVTIKKFFGAFSSFSFYSIQRKIPVEFSGLKDISNKSRRAFLSDFRSAIMNTGKIASKKKKSICMTMKDGGS